MDPYCVPAFSLTNRLLRLVWGGVWLFFFRTSPSVLHAWRRFLLKCFGANIGPKCAIHSSVKIWAPWNLICEDMVAIGAKVEIYNPSEIVLKSHAIISSGAYLCGATHEYDNYNFPLISKKIIIGKYAWVCARATVLLGVSVGEGAVLALGSVATRDILDWTIVGGVPAKLIGERKRLF